MNSSVVEVHAAQFGPVFTCDTVVPGLTLPGPITGIRRVLAACEERQYAQAARWFRCGMEIWAICPDYVKEYLDLCSESGAARSFTVEAEDYRGDAALLLVTVFADPDRRWPLATRPWRFHRRGDGWIIERVG